LLLVAFLLVNALNCHLSLVLASVFQGDAVNCNSYRLMPIFVGNAFLYSSCIPSRSVIFVWSYRVTFSEK